MDFTWFYYIGRVKLHLSTKEIGRLTLRTFFKFYQHYKDDFDLELELKKLNKTYANIEAIQQQNDEWF